MWGRGLGFFARRHARLRGAMKKTRANSTTIATLGSADESHGWIQFLLGCSSPQTEGSERDRAL